MSILDLSDNCNIFNNTFQQDLLDYTLSDTSIKWSDGSESPYTIKQIGGESIFDYATKTNYWSPYIIDNDDASMYKILSHYGSICNTTEFKSNRLGIENFISFTPKFKNWMVDSNGQMVVDWILNRGKSAYTIYGGLLCWGRKSNTIQGSIDEFPIYSRLKYQNNTYIKIDRNLLRKINPESAAQYIFKSGDVFFDYTSNPDIVVGESSNFNADTIFTLDNSDTKELWVADGDNIFYYFNQIEKFMNLRDGIGPRSFVSSSLYQKYINIYNVLTINEKLVSVNDTRPLKKQRLYKKLAHALSTSPFISDFFISLLLDPPDSIKQSIDQYLNSVSNDMVQDIQNLKNVLVSISKEFSQYEIQDKNNIIKNNQQLFNKFILKYGAKLQLTKDSTITFKNVLKHGDSILYNEIGDMLVDKNITDTTIVNNKTVSLGQIGYETNFSENNATILLKVNNETKNTIYLYNHAKPEVIKTLETYVDFQGATNTNGSSVGIVLSTNYIDGEDAGSSNTTRNKFLSESVEDTPFDVSYSPRWWKGSGSVLYWGFEPRKDNNGNLLPFPVNIYPRLKAFDLAIDPRIGFSDTSVFGRGKNIKNLLMNQFICQWEKVSGPDLDFVDLNKNPVLSAELDTPINKEATGKTANGQFTIMVPRSTGKYVIKCTINSPYGSYITYKTIFVVFAKGEFAGRYSLIEDDILNLDTTLMEIFYNSPEGVDLNDYSVLVTDNMIVKYSAENRRTPINNDNLKVYGANLGAYAIHRNGLFSGVDSEYYVETIFQLERPIEKLSNNNYLFMFSEQENIAPKIDNSSFTIKYTLNDTVIKLDQIILENLRNNTAECGQCYSLYSPKFRAYTSRRSISDTGRTIFRRSKKAPGSFDVQRYIYDDIVKYYRPVSTGMITYQFPLISTDLSPPIKTYGGYGNQVIQNLPINSIPEHKLPKSLDQNKGVIANDPEILPNTTGHYLNYEDDFLGVETTAVLGPPIDIGYKFCYQKNIVPTGYIEFTKGMFHPSSGWIIQDDTNLSSVLKFNPGARSSYSFAGPGIDRLSIFADETVGGNIFKSSIELNINSAIRWDPGKPVVGEDCCEEPEVCIIEEEIAYNLKNPQDLELGDQWQSTVAGEANAGYHHGYRILNGGIPKFAEPSYNTPVTVINDEFNIEINKSENKHLYSFNKVGPYLPITEPDNELIKYLDGKLETEQDKIDFRNFFRTSQANGTKNFGPVNPRVNSLTIKDIEVRLNFLNYVNTKDLIVWLEIENCDLENNRVKPITAGRSRTSKSPIVTSTKFINQSIPADTYKSDYIPGYTPSYSKSDSIDVKNKDINEFLKNLTDHNSVDDTHTKMKLYLLNQETIQNQQYNFSVTFSDSADKNTKLFDINSFGSSRINPDQHILQDKGFCQPTTFLPNYTTKENTYYHNLIKFHQLNVTNNTFHKFANKTLFKNSVEGECVPLFSPLESSTKFTLHIAVMDEPDEMFPMDMVINSDLYTNLNKVTNTVTSSNILNNLCNWELILHTEDVKKPTVGRFNNIDTYGASDALSLIEYGKRPQYPGYSFIADLKDIEFLLPYTNINAPNTYFQNCNLCTYLNNDSIIGDQPFINRPRFPSEAILAITANRAGALVLGNAGPYGDLQNWFEESAAIYNLELSQRETYDVEYNNFLFGSPDKILLNISNDGCFWYKLEASIFKLDNTPSLNLKTYKFMKQDNSLFKFDFNIVLDITDLVDEFFVEYIIDKDTCEDLCDISKIDTEIILNNQTYIAYNKVLGDNNIFNYLNDSNHIIIKIAGDIAFNLYDINDKVYFNECNPEITTETPPTVKAKSLVYQGNQYYTILVINKDFDNLNCNKIYLPDNVIVVYDDKPTNISSNISPISEFSLLNDPIPNQGLVSYFSTNSTGSYGEGTIVKNKNILSELSSAGSIISLYKILNNNKNDKFNYNELTIDIDNSKTIINKKFSAYPAYYNRSNNRLQNNNFYHIYNDSEDIRNLLNNAGVAGYVDNSTYIKDQQYNVLYIKIDSETISKLPRNSLGNITIENSYDYNDSIEAITQEQLDLLVNRLEMLNNENVPDLDRLIGNGRSTLSFTSQGSIKYMKDHYEALPEDSVNCGDRCYKQIAFNELTKLYIERNAILELLEDQTIRSVDIQQKKNETITGVIEYETKDTIKLIDNPIIFDKASLLSIKYLFTLNPEKQVYNMQKGGVIAKKRANISTTLNNAILIEYEPLTENKYWINIDPKQSCSIAEELRPKILKATHYSYALTNPFTTLLNIYPDNNVCPDFLGKVGDGFGEIDFKPGPGYVLYLEKGVQLKQERNIDFRTLDLGYLETVSGGPIEEQKQNIEKQFPDSIAGWEEKKVVRSFRVHNDKSIDGVLDDNEFLVYSTEIYDVAVTKLEKAKDKTGAQLVEEGIIKNDYSKDIDGLLDGLSKDSRYRRPTRVYNIFNMDNLENIKVQIKKVPRMIRGIDLATTVLRYGANTSYRPRSIVPAEAPDDIFSLANLNQASLINNFYCWTCYQLNPNDYSVIKAKTPEFFALMNEMWFRAFFGSVDNIETKNDIMKSMYDWESIPFEYFTKPPEKPEESN